MQGPSEMTTDEMRELVMTLLRRAGIKESRHALYANNLAPLGWDGIIAAVRTSTLASVHRLSFTDARTLSCEVDKHRRAIAVRNN